MGVEQRGSAASLLPFKDSSAPSAYNGDVVAFKMGRRQGGPSR
jgi:hypothetical protein